MSLPSEFKFYVDIAPEFIHSCKRNDVGDYEVDWAEGWRSAKERTDFWTAAEEREIRIWVESGSWIIAKPTLTAEQQRTLRDFKERHAQLAQSIKLNEQDIYHKQRLIESYQIAQKDLESKIKDIEEGV